MPAQAIGDDRLQLVTGRGVVPVVLPTAPQNSATAGFNVAFDSGDPAQCNCVWQAINRGRDVSDIDALRALTSQMTQEGIRRYWSSAATRRGAGSGRAGRYALHCPVLTGCGSRLTPAQPCCTPQALPNAAEDSNSVMRYLMLTGAFDAAAFAALSGTLSRSWLLLLI